MTENTRVMSVRLPFPPMVLKVPKNWNKQLKNTIIYLFRFTLKLFALQHCLMIVLMLKVYLLVICAKLIL